MTLRDASVMRAVKASWTARPAIEGAGVRLLRVFGFDEVPQMDPFLLLDAFRSDRPEDYRAGFPWHPHRGIETITVLLDGDIEHADSLGNRGLLSSGDVQWMTAGSGIIHHEMPQGDARGRLTGFQLWANLPASSKMMAPRYQDVRAADIPVARASGGATLRVIAGEVEGVRGPVRDIVTEPELLDVTVPAGSEWVHAVPAGRSAFACVFEGAGSFDESEERAAVRHATDEFVQFGDGETVRVTTGSSPVRFLFGSGRPLAEPVAWAGPIVMNTREELRAAFRELDAGTFVRAR